MNKKPIDVNLFSNNRLLHLTLGDFQKMKINDEIEVVSFHRNYEEYDIWYKYKVGELVAAKDLLEGNHCTLRRTGAFKWIIIFHFLGEENEWDIHLNVENLSTNWRWISCDGMGVIEITNEELRNGDKIPDGNSKISFHVNSLHEDTRVGWRGAMMLWKHVLDAPELFWVEP